MIEFGINIREALDSIPEPKGGGEMEGEREGGREEYML